MIKSRSLGIMEAIEVVKELSMTKSLRYWYETELQLRRNRKAEDDYVREEGRAEDREEGKAEGRIEGRAEGKAEDIVELLEDVGVVSEELRKKIFVQKDMEVLRRWHKFAARVRSIDEFEQQVIADNNPYFYPPLFQDRKALDVNSPIAYTEASGGYRPQPSG